ncbi:U3 small nucleolar RNA-associated protein 8 [Yarrowia sp. B02]|nr:U3 small nucleolar RNA-associated protein 8 [Yarrowia sp. B02]
MPPLTEPFVLCDLPQSSLTVAAKVAVPGRSAGSQYLLGISHSQAALYELTPSPRSVWTHFLSLTQAVCAITQYAPNTKTGVVYVSIRDRKKFFVERVERGVEAEDGNKSSLALSEAAVAVGTSSDDSRVYLVTESGHVKVAPVSLFGQTGSGDKIPTLFDAGEKQTTEYSLFMPDSRTDEFSDGLLVLVLGSRDSYRAVLLGLKQSGCVVLADKVLKDIATDSKPAFTAVDNVLSCFSNTTLYSFALPSLKVTTQIERPEGASGNSSILAIDSRTTLLSSNDKLTLVDTYYESIVAEVDASQLSLLSFYPDTQTVLGVQPQKGGFCVSGVTVDLSSGSSLLDSVARGQGLQTSATREQQRQHDWRMSNIHIAKTYRLESDFADVSGYDVVVKAAKKSQKQSQALLETLKTSQGAAFDAALLKYMKHKKWLKQNPELAFTVYEERDDAQIDNFLMDQICSLLFDNYEDSEPVLKADPPVKALTYLLTHSLFPTNRFPNLLDTFESHPFLQRQALVNAPALPCSTLVKALGSSVSDEIVNDAVVRLLEEFRPTEVTKTIRKEITDLNGLVQRLQKIDAGWALIPCVIDAGGLLGWNLETIQELKDALKTELQSQTEAAQTVAMVDALKLRMMAQDRVAMREQYIEKGDDKLDASYVVEKLHI